MNIYDLLLNFHNNYYEFYEWNENDDLFHIKKIGLIKINSEDYQNILNKKVIFDDDFLLSIFNRCEYFENKKILTIPYAVLLTDSYRVMAIILDMNGNVVKYSSLELLDEEDVLDVSDKLGSVKIKYQIVDDGGCNFDKTREEREIINYIRNDLNESLKHEKYDKLKYLYYEYFNKESNNIDEIKNDFDKEFLKEISDKHYKLYNLIKLSRQCKKV